MQIIQQIFGYKLAIIGFFYSDVLDGSKLFSAS